mgnify:CR=1 FL=1
MSVGSIVKNTVILVSVLWSFAIIAVVGSIGWNWFLVLSTGSGFVGFRHHRCVGSIGKDLVLLVFGQDLDFVLVFIRINKILSVFINFKK